MFISALLFSCRFRSRSRSCMWRRRGGRLCPPGRKSKARYDVESSDESCTVRLREHPRMNCFKSSACPSRPPCVCCRHALSHGRNQPFSSSSALGGLCCFLSHEHGRSFRGLSSASSANFARLHNPLGQRHQSSFQRHCRPRRRMALLPRRAPADASGDMRRAGQSAGRVHRSPYPAGMAG